MDNTYDDMLTNRTLAQRFKEHFARLGVETVDTPRQNKGSLDMGNVSRVLPSVHGFIRVADPDTPIHSAAFARATATPEADEVLMTAVKAMSLTGWDALTDSDLLAGARREFAAAPR